MELENLSLGTLGTWVFSQWRVRGSGPPSPPPYQAWRLYGTETVVNRQDRMSIRRVLSAPTATGDHRLRNTWSSPWEVNCHKKKINSPFWTKVWTPNQKFLDPLQTFLLAHRRWVTFREEVPTAAMSEEKRLPFAGYGSSPVQKLQAIVGLRNTCFENWTWMERPSRNF